MTVSRRRFLQGAGVLGAGALAGASGLDATGQGLRLLMAGAAPVASPAEGLGGLVTDPAGRLDLPPGFSYKVVTRAGRQMPAPQTGRVPGRPDGTGTFAGPGGNISIVQNHEQGATADFPVVAAANLTYDPGAKGGTTTIVVDGDRQVVTQSVSLAGTMMNCGGGPTPWGTWLTGEESEKKAGGALTKNHGYVFEVDPSNRASNLNPVPLTAMGRFAHENVAVDPERGHVYLSEDAVQPNGLLYRFTPATLPNALHSLRDGGVLEVMKARGADDLSVYTTVGTTLDVTWIAVPDPTALSQGSIRKQFTYVDRTHRATPHTVTRPGGAITRSRKLEGLCWNDGKAQLACSFARTSDPTDWSRAEHDGQIWSYDPATSTLALDVFFKRNTQPFGSRADQPDGPDNISPNPHGGLVVAEDGGGIQHLLFVTPEGRKQVFARNAVSLSEFTGVAFSPRGDTLFASIQDEGYTFAITGPFVSA